MTWAAPVVLCSHDAGLGIVDHSCVVDQWVLQPAVTVGGPVVIGLTAGRIAICAGPPRSALGSGAAHVVASGIASSPLSGSAVHAARRMLDEQRDGPLAGQSVSVVAVGCRPEAGLGIEVAGGCAAYLVTDGYLGRVGGSSAPVGEYAGQATATGVLSVSARRLVLASSAPLEDAGLPMAWRDAPVRDSRSWLEVLTRELALVLRQPVSMALLGPGHPVGD